MPLAVYSGCAILPVEGGVGTMHLERQRAELALIMLGLVLLAIAAGALL